MRAAVPSCVGDAALSILKHGADLVAATQELASRLGVVPDWPEDSQLVRESNGLKLFVNPAMASGYTRVVRTSDGRYFEAFHSRDGVRESLGIFGSPVEAAVAYARHRRDSRAARCVDPLLGGGGDGGGEEEEGWELRDSDSPTRYPIESDDESTETGGEGGAILQERRQAAFNRSIEPLLHDDGASGVVPLSVTAATASACADFLRDHWVDGQLLLPGCSHEYYEGPQHRQGSRRPDAETPKCIKGWTTYAKTLTAHDAELQQRTTLLFSNALLPACRQQIPGFRAIENELIGWLHSRFGTVVELFYAHGRMD